MMNTGRHLFLTLALAATTPAYAQVTYVRAGATGANDGSSWTNAYVELQTALLATAAGEIWVAEGVYRPSPPGTRSASFSLRSAVAVYGGFAGHESSRFDRQGRVEATILSGDLLGDDDGWSNRLDNSYHVARAENVDATAILDGFTIYGGYATAASGFDGYGAGLLVVAASPTVRGCAFDRNLAAGAGGAYVYSGGPWFDGCTFQGNWGYIYNGGGLYCYGPGTTVTACVFSGNIASSGTQGAGGGLYASGAITIDGCTFTGNRAEFYFSGYYPCVGGGAFLGGDGAVLRNCTFAGNETNLGGALTCYADTSLVNCVFSGNRAFAVDLGSYSVGGYGGALHAAYAVLTLEGCTFSGNDATEDGGGIYVDYTNDFWIENCVLWGNEAAGAQSTFDANIADGDNGGFTLQWSCVGGVDTQKYPNCTALDPRFTDADGADNWPGTEDDDLRPRVGSPCIDAGRNAGLGGVALDRDGGPRFVDDPSTYDRGQGAPPIADMGAYEFDGSGPLLANSALRRGHPATFTVTGAQPGETASFYYGFRGLGAGPALPQYGGMALDLRAPVRQLGVATAGPDGVAAFTGLVPANAPLRTVYLQAAIARGIGGADSVRTNPTSARIQP
ncbi:MAG: right-handed parallel beta-helix repeat-containing protein [Planctomycetota bacterium]|nr:MAG: right-handed parallel beta-helix repeat-containing protein [Planctomycetota bacterium]